MSKSFYSGFRIYSFPFGCIVSLKLIGESQVLSISFQFGQLLIIEILKKKILLNYLVKFQPGQTTNILGTEQLHVHNKGPQQGAKDIILPGFRATPKDNQEREKRLRYYP